jgi:hypothetical protein
MAPTASRTARPAPAPGPARFEGFGPRALTWLEALAADNSRASFEAMRETYEAQVRGPLAALLGELAQALGGTVRLGRAHRDVRFSQDKSPYRTDAAGVLRHTPSGLSLAVQLSAAGLHARVGATPLASDQLVRYRAALRAPGPRAELDAALEGLALVGLRLQRDVLGEAAPDPAAAHGEADAPPIPLERLKGLLVGGLLPAGPALFTREALAHADRTWHLSEPLRLWLGRHVGPSSLQMDPRRRRP